AMHAKAVAALEEGKGAIAEQLSRSKQDLEEANSLLESSRADVFHLTEETASLIRSRDDLASELALLKSQLEAALEDINKTKTALVVALDTEQKEAARFQEEKYRLEEELKGTVDELAALKAQYDLVEESLAVSENSMHAFEKDLGSLKREYDVLKSRHDATLADLSSAKERAETLEGRLAAMNDELAGKQSELELSRRGVIDLTATLEEALKAFANEKSVNDLLQENLALLYVSMQTKDIELAIKHEAVGTHESTLSECRQKLSESEELCRSQGSELLEQEEVIAGLEAELAELKVERDSLLQRLASAEELSTSRAKEITRLNEMHDSLKIQFDMLEADNMQSTTKLAEAKDALTNLTETLGDTASAIGALQDEIVALKGQCAAMSEECNVAKHECTAMQLKLQEAAAMHAKAVAALEEGKGAIAEQLSRSKQDLEEANS
ncbi:MAG: hypothetical protein EBY29_15460, partial [Planctomycetes bacterium]|nr:hypothetical protein [Planctomycetota bacterium]